jgi:hypothetical protein
MEGCNLPADPHGKSNAGCPQDEIILCGCYSEHKQCGKSINSIWAPTFVKKGKENRPRIGEDGTSWEK